MANDAQLYFNSCDTCQVLIVECPSKHSIPVTDVWNQIGIDIVGPLLKSVRGNKYIITVTEYFSMWPEAGSIPEKSAVGVANFLFSLFSRHGWPKIVMSDQGREFVNAVSNYLFEKTGSGSSNQ